MVVTHVSATMKRPSPKRTLVSAGGIICHHTTPAFWTLLQVSREEALAVAGELGVPYVETSAETAHQVRVALLVLCERAAT